MPLKYALYPNPFRKKEYMASVQPDRISTLDDLLKDMVKQSRHHSAAELHGILTLFLETVNDHLQKNHHIHLPFLKITTSISGKFADEQDRFDPKRHRVNVKVNPGKELTAFTKQLKVQKVSPTRPTPCIRSVWTFNQLGSQTATPGEAVEIKGMHLKIDKSDPRQGLFLTGAGLPNLHITRLYHNLSTRLFFEMPQDVPAGEYRFMIRTTVGNSTELRQGYSSSTIQVPPSAPRV